MQSIKLAFVYNVDPTSPNRQSQHPHLRQSSCQNKSKALSKNRSVILFPQPAHSLGPVPDPLGAAETEVTDPDVLSVRVARPAA